MNTNIMNVADPETESYLLLLLSDGNLPTGSFVASSGLESLYAHSLATITSASTKSHGSSPQSANHTAPKPSDPLLAVTSSLRDILSSYARSATPFVRDTLQVLHYFCETTQPSEAALDQTTGKLLELDALYECTTLNHVARRASSTQGVALLTLYSKGFSVPSFISPQDHKENASKSGEISSKEEKVAKLVDRLKLLVRRGDTPGHLPICYGVLAGALGLSVDRAIHLHLFLHARSLLSASIRMNTLGPYAAQQLLLHVVRPLVDSEVKLSAHLCTGISLEFHGSEVEVERSVEAGSQNNMFGNGDGHGQADEDVWAASDSGPANTWPLGEIVAARHDLLHSRIFNS